MVLLPAKPKAKSVPKKRGRPTAKAAPKPKPKPKATPKAKSSAKAKSKTRTSQPKSSAQKPLKMDWNNIYSRCYHAKRRAGLPKEEAGTKTHSKCIVQ